MLFFLGLPPTIRVIGVTGTKGKTTTATLIYRFLSTRFRTHIAGIPGTSYLSLLRKMRRNDVVVLELSSFDLEGLAQIQRAPQVAVITNIHRDHLNRYPTFRAYVRAKTNIFSFQSQKGVLLLNKDEGLWKFLRKMAPGKVLGFSVSELWKYQHILGHSPWVITNGSNVLAAYKVAKLFGVSDRAIRLAVSKVPVLKGRLEILRETRNRIIFVNDTCSTTPFSTAYGIKAFRRLYPIRPIILIAGGEDKNLDFREIAPALGELSGIVLLPGSASYKLRRAAIQRGVPVYQIFRKQRALDRAVRIAAKCARGALCSRGAFASGEASGEGLGGKVGGIILFSPAAASFNMFQNEFDRGRQFVAAVRNL